MALIRRSAEARSDLIAIWAYIAQNNQPAADKLIEDIDRNLVRLLKFPLLGEAVDHLRPGTRRVIVGNYQLFYEPSADAILCLACLSLIQTYRRLVQFIVACLG